MGPLLRRRGAFLTCGSAGWLGPLIIYLTSGPKDPFVKDQAAEALNFQITIAIGLVVSAMLMIVLIGFVVYPIVWLVGVIFGVSAAARPTGASGTATPSRSSS